MVDKRLVVWGALLGTFLLLAGEAVQSFRPPRTAVVDISQVFDSYEKKKDRQAEFESEIKQVKEKLSVLEKQYKDLVAELGNLGSGEKKNQLQLEKFKLEQQVKDLNQTETGRLRETQMKYLKEIRDEITAEIKAYAEAQDIDLVLEATVVGEMGPEVGQFRWPIVHYSKPELEITAEIAQRLNARYRP